MLIIALCFFVGICTGCMLFSSLHLLIHVFVFYRCLQCWCVWYVRAMEYWVPICDFNFMQSDLDLQLGFWVSLLILILCSIGMLPCWSLCKMHCQSDRVIPCSSSDLNLGFRVSLSILTLSLIRVLLCCRIRLVRDEVMESSLFWGCGDCCGRHALKEMKRARILREKEVAKRKQLESGREWLEEGTKEEDNANVFFLHLTTLKFSLQSRSTFVSFASVF